MRWTACWVCLLLLDAIHCPWVTFFRSKSVDLKDFNGFHTISCWKICGVRWRHCIFDDQVPKTVDANMDVETLLQARICWCFLHVLLMFSWRRMGHCPWLGILEWILSRMLGTEETDRGFEAQAEHKHGLTWPDMAWHGRTALLENMSTQGSQFQRRTGESWWIMKTNRVFAWLAKNCKNVPDWGDTTTL